jgi:prepilin-type N-terminal cleavage/methylation domain-containing protein
MKGRVRRAFTLIEVILAIAIGAMVLCAASSYLFSLTQLYTLSAGAFGLEEHADNVSEWIYEALMASKTEGRGVENDIRWISESDFYDGRAVLAFNLTADAPIPAGSIPAMSLLDALLFFDDQEAGGGLWIATRPFEKLNRSSEAAKPLFTPLSPYVKSIVYFYYDVDSNEWSNQPLSASSDSGSNKKLPIFLEVKFDNGLSDPLTRRIFLPTLPVGLTKGSAQSESDKNRSRSNAANKNKKKNNEEGKNASGSTTQNASKNGSANAKKSVFLSSPKESTAEG